MPAEPANRRRRGALIAALVIGLGLAAAPAVFGMFSRAPAGGSMIEDFRPYMRESKIADFRAELDVIGAAAGEAPRGTAAVDAWAQQWPAIDDDMGEMLTIMRDDIDEFRGVSALPPFALFPWFFVLPGLIIAGLAGAALLADRRGRPWPRLRVALAVMGIAVIAAPAIFQMFGRAPGGARMIDDFRPLMTTEKVTSVQQYFLVIGAAEGDLRTSVLPRTDAADFPATTRFVRDWPETSHDMAPMIGAMSDNVDNFAGIDALPPFWLFPWFFVVPGLLVALLAFASRDIDPDRARAVQLIERTAPS
jgi:hypothetical protein